MSYKPNFKIKHRDRIDSNKNKTIKDTYDRMSKEKRNLHKDEPFVLMFRNFIFFDVKSYECRNGDLYIRNIVDGIILKRYFRMGSDDQLTVFKNREEFDAYMKSVKEKGYWRMNGDDQLTVFKNREEFDAYMKSVKEKGYWLGPDKPSESKEHRDWHKDYIARKKEREHHKEDGVSPDEIIKNWSICDNELFKSRAIKSKVTGQLVFESIDPELVNKVYSILQDNESSIKSLLKQASDDFVLENFTATRNSETGKIDVITSTWDGSSVTRDEGPEVFDYVVSVLEANPGSAQIFTKKDFM